MESGIEASIHAVADKFKEETSEGVLLVDAKNAFNLLNIKVAIHNVQHLCPPMYTFLNNSYHQHNKLFLKDGSVIMSKEGVTQGDPLSMAIYALSTRKLIEALREKAPDVLQAWFADDDTAVGSIVNLRVYWEYLKTIGPMYGYHPEPSKTILILKSKGLLDLACKLVVRR